MKNQIKTLLLLGVLAALLIGIVGAVVRGDLWATASVRTLCTAPQGKLFSRLGLPALMPTPRNW